MIAEPRPTTMNEVPPLTRYLEALPRLPPVHKLIWHVATHKPQHLVLKLLFPRYKEFPKSLRGAAINRAKMTFNPQFQSLLPAKAALTILWLQPRAEQTGTKVKGLTKIIDMFLMLIVHIRSIIKSFMIPASCHYPPFFSLFSFLKIGYLPQGTSLDFNKGLVKSKFTLSTDITLQLSKGNCNHRDKQRILPAGSVSGRRMPEPDLC